MQLGDGCVVTFHFKAKRSAAGGGLPIRQTIADGQCTWSDVILDEPRLFSPKIQRLLKPQHLFIRPPRPFQVGDGIAYEGDASFFSPFVRSSIGYKPLARLQWENPNDEAHYIRHRVKDGQLDWLM